MFRAPRSQGDPDVHLDGPRMLKLARRLFAAMILPTAILVAWRAIAGLMG